MGALSVSIKNAETGSLPEKMSANLAPVSSRVFGSSKEYHSMTCGSWYHLKMSGTSCRQTGLNEITHSGWFMASIIQGSAPIRRNGALFGEFASVIAYNR